MSYLQHALGYALHRAQLSVLGGIVEVFADHQVTTMEFLIMVIVSENPGISQADVADALEVERPRMVPTLNKLEKRGLAKRTVPAEDGRVRQIFLTKRGQHLVGVLQKRSREYQNEMMARLTEAEAKTIISSLWKLAGREKGTCPLSEPIVRRVGQKAADR